MSRASVLILMLMAVPGAAALAQSTATAPAKLTAAEIVDRNVAARGGLTKWRGVRTLSWSGKLEAGGNNQRLPRIPGIQPPPPSEDPSAQVQLPFVLEMARPHKTRFEIQFAGNTAVQVYDGTEGWKMRPFLNRLDWEPFAPEEVKAAESLSDLDGALVDYVAKGTRIDLEGVDPVEGRDAYKLKLTLQNGRVVHEWIDAGSFLEVKIEGTPRRLDGKEHAVSIFLRDYRTVSGLLLPHQIETVVQGVQRTEKIQIEKIEINPRVDEARFTRPT